MKRDPDYIPPHERMMTEEEFMESFNKNMPSGYPHVTKDILTKFKAIHPGLFKGNGSWSLDTHRKRMIEWLPQNV